MKIFRSKYFLSFKKEENTKNNTVDNTIENMTRAGFIQQESSGIYSWLLPGTLMLEKISKIIDKHLEKANALKIIMPTIQDAALWKKSNRFNEYGPEILKIKDRNERDYVYGPTAEEAITNLISGWNLNKNSFPLIAYNTQWKFRDEIRPRFGIVRGREFLMNDTYSFHKTEDCMMETYQKMFAIYSAIFQELNLNVATFKADVGLMGGIMSHEFVVKSSYGEASLEYEKWPEQPLKWSEKDNLTEAENNTEDKYSENDKYCEIAHIYALGDKYTKTFKAHNPENNLPLLMGCYGIGVSRIAAIIFENAEHDLGKASPFDAIIISISSEVEETCKTIMNLFPENQNIIFDDRNVSGNISYGQKCIEADLLKAPLQIHVGKKELESGSVIIKTNGKKETILLNDLVNYIDIK